MASEYNSHHLNENSPHPPSIEAISLHIRANDQSNQDELHQHQHQQSQQPKPHEKTSNNSFRFENQPQKILNDAHLILSRRLNVSLRSRKDLELMCEEKVSKYKLEEVHCSLPSSNKSTFIMTFSPDGQRVASTHGDHRIYICDLNTGKLLDTLEGHPKTPWCLAWHPSNREILASGCLAGEVRVWDLRSKACESWTSENNTIITSLDFHPRERILVIATANDIHFWDWSETEPFAKSTTTHDKEKVKFVEFDSSGTKLITGISNLPKYTGYNDSLQNRIFDSYLTQGTLEPIPTQENMTQNSEITGQLNSHLNSINNNNININNVETFNERNAGQTISTRQSTPLNNNNELDISYRSTLTLSRVAFLYRQLEALEDSMRHTSFSPYVHARPADSSTDNSDITAARNINQETIEPSVRTNSNNNDPTSTSRDLPPTYESSQNRIDQMPQPPAALNEQVNSSQQTTSRPTTRAPNNSEPFVVSFDEFLENLHLIPLIIDGQTINPASVIEQYPIDLPYQLHYIMQFESINQVNQNFIRISKLMSSVRLYRQIVQQILSNNSGQGHYQPNQILTAQSASTRSSRHASNLPIVFHNVPLPMGLNTDSRSTDPIIAIQFRNSARNVPLVTICKIDLLSSRSICIMRSQQLIEQMISNSRVLTDEQMSTTSTTSVTNVRSEEQPSLAPPQNFNRLSAFSVEANPPFYPLLNQLHQSLSVINHAPLTTSNVHTHISSLRSLINKLLTTLSSMFQTQEEGSRLISLIYDIACSLTGRSWSIPLGANLDDIRLDVIHTLCIVDLTLHVTRQVQLLQMQRLSAAARIEESRRMATATSFYRESSRQIPINDTADSSGSSNINTQSVPVNLPSVEQVVENCLRPSTSRECSNNSSKRKDASSAPAITAESKRRKIANEEKEIDQSIIPDVEMIEQNQRTTRNSLLVDAQLLNSPTNLPVNSNLNSYPSPTPYQQSANLTGNLSDNLPHDRLVIWNSATQPQSVEQSLQRFLVATAASLNNNHILVRIYHRLHGSPTLPTNNILEQSTDRQSIPPYESRRRALSQDNATATAVASSASMTVPDNPILNTSDHHARSRAPFVHPVMSSSDGWQRHPHLHVYQTRGTGQHLWFNQWTIPLPVSNSNYRLQCWDFSSSTIPNIKDSQSNIVTHKCRIHNDASIDISGDGSLIACLVPHENGACLPSFDLKIFSLKSYDFGSCYYQLPHGPNAISVSLSPSASYAVVGLASNKIISNNPNEDDLTIAKVFKLNGKKSIDYVRDIKIKRDDSSLSLNAIRWMSRGIVYNVGPQHHQRYQATRLRHRVAQT